MYVNYFTDFDFIAMPHNLVLCTNHRYRPEISEPTPSLSWHGAQFSRDQNDPDLSGAYVLRTESEDKHL